MKFGLKEEDIERINSVFEKNTEVESVVIYGSRAIGNYRTGSDIDLALKGKALSTDVVSKIIDEIEELNTPYIFDFLIFENLRNTVLISHINRVGKIFYTNKTLHTV